jgi:hypothetical protein
MQPSLSLRRALLQVQLLYAPDLFALRMASHAGLLLRCRSALLMESKRWQRGCPRWQGLRRCVAYGLYAGVYAGPDPWSFELQVPMSRFEPEEYVNDRYAAIEERLAVRRVAMTACHLWIRLSTSSCAAGCAEAAQQAHDAG